MLDGLILPLTPDIVFFIAAFWFYIKPHYMIFDPAAPEWQRTGDRASSMSCQ